VNTVNETDDQREGERRTAIVFETKTLLTVVGALVLFTIGFIEWNASRVVTSVDELTKKVDDLTLKVNTNENFDSAITEKISQLHGQRDQQLKSLDDLITAEAQHQIVFDRRLNAFESRMTCLEHGVHGGCPMVPQDR
jgi:hypothetical protein